MNGASNVICPGMIEFDVDRRPDRIVARIEVHKGRFNVNVMGDVVLVENMNTVPPVIVSRSG